MAVALGFGAYAYGNNGSGNSNSGVANTAPSSAAAPGPRNGQAPPGLGTPVSGVAATKARAAALARYKGTVEQVMKLDDGSYVVHVITSDGEYHVAVSKDFKVTGTQPGGPGAGGPAGGAPPAGSSPSGGHNVVTN